MSKNENLKKVLCVKNDFLVGLVSHKCKKGAKTERDQQRNLVFFVKYLGTIFYYHLYGNFG